MTINLSYYVFLDEGDLLQTRLTKILLVSGSLTEFLVQSTTGIGAPDKGIWILIGSPARTLIFLPIRPSKYSFGFSGR